MECFTAIVSSITSEITKSLVDPVTQQIGYLIYYNHNISNLQVEIKQLDNKNTGLNLHTGKAERNLQIIAPEVVHWQEEVDRIKEKVAEFLENEIKRNNKCLNGLCTNPKSRYSLSSKAKKMTLEITTMLQKAGNFGEIACPAPPPNIGSIFNMEGIKDFESRLSIMNEVWEALKDDELSMISICGMGGVGKTTMVQKLVKRVEKERLFDEVAMAVVSQNPDLKKIQGEIAEQLGLKFDEETLLGRAGRLRERVMNCGKKVLLILDDVWDKLDFGTIGLPFRGERKGYKIVLTSRNEDACCKDIRSQKNFPIKVLSDNEAWELFREIAGGDIEHSNIYPIARKVAKECGGLPIAIVTIARALENESKDIWESALQELQKAKFENIRGQNEVFSRIELSYNYLRSEEAKSCFLLCCLFPEDFSILVEDLIRYGMGLSLFKDVDTLHQVRTKIPILINQLKRSFLLLEGDKYKCKSVKMHDVVRDVALSIASKDKHWQIVRHELLRNDAWDLNLPYKFFEGKEELKVLYLDNSLLPQSIIILKKLRTLHLERVTEISAISALTNLQILTIETQNLKEFPQEIGELINLRLLDLKEMSNLEYIPSGVLSRLSKLEELYVTPRFRKWEYTDDRGKNASLNELKPHPITALQIAVQEISLWPKDSVFTSLINFKIFIVDKDDDLYFYRRDFHSMNHLFLEGDPSEIRASGICALMRKTEVLTLLNIQHLQNVLYKLEENGFPNLKALEVFECKELEYVVDAMERIPQIGFPHLESLWMRHLPNLKEIWRNLTSGVVRNNIQLSCFCNLKDIKISYCHKLKYVFLLSMAGGLRQLQNINIENCKEMEGIFYGKEVDDEIEFPKLIKLNLSVLPKLIGFWAEMDDATCQVSMMMKNKDASVSNIHYQNNLMYCAFPSKLIARMPNLKEIFIRRCNTLEVIFSFEECHDAIQALNSLEKLDLQDLPNLRDIWFKIPTKITAFQNLRELVVVSCDNLIHLFSPCVAKLLVKLQVIIVWRCRKMKEIIAKEEEAVTEDRMKIVFPQLRSLQLSHLAKLRSFYSGIYDLEFPLLEELDFRGWSKMKTLYIFSYGCSKMSTPKLKKINGNKYLVRGDINAAMKEEMLREVCIFDEETLTRIGYDQLPNGDLSKLLILQVKNCKNLVNVIPCNLIASLQNLEKLIVRRCESLMEIFEYEGVNIEEERNVVTFSHFEEIQLRGLPKLVHIFNKVPKNVIAFQNMRKLSISYCNSLRNIFSVSVAKGLVQLQRLNVSGSEMLEEIVAKEDEEEQEASLDRIVFPQLKSLRFSDLPKLRSFYGGIYALELSLLETLKFVRCDGMKTFSCGSLTTPKLKELTIGYEDHQLMGDLNATVSHFFNLKEKDETDSTDEEATKKQIEIPQDLEFQSKEQSEILIEQKSEA